jgi:hypothetical protein
VHTHLPQLQQNCSNTVQPTQSNIRSCTLTAKARNPTNQIAELPMQYCTDTRHLPYTLLPCPNCSRGAQNLHKPLKASPHSAANITNTHDSLPQCFLIPQGRLIPQGSQSPTLLGNNTPIVEPPFPEQCTNSCANSPSRPPRRHL